jgi:hypothetical protein
LAAPHIPSLATPCLLDGPDAISLLLEPSPPSGRSGHFSFKFIAALSTMRAFLSLAVFHIQLQMMIEVMFLALVLHLNTGFENESCLDSICGHRVLLLAIVTVAGIIATDD